ncbi:Swt1 family HEPN domain-containing protein [Streptomyces sp. AK02-01A]|uniref:Swt1 family HEPN domain-containing protein n=1 Tax=Streptomyces sp. AK02-01A TaxID=3028648 RepID=UPI0029BD6251|nr:Swt1 family HEPN domain-containing protein [Streptomyces sp. AK02-01A]MDX3854160.1 Swt1 family HEPN domain-containing protein [Streptomyces sp. AK02-01A]
MPEETLALYSRWWQLETYLRSLTYVELRAKYGIHWTNQIGQGATSRREKDESRSYMATADWEDPLSYLDVGKLFPILEANWDLVEPSLINKEALMARTSELLAIRHRLGHLRRPHRDDLSRLEQTLRDLEKGAFTAYASYNREFGAPGDLNDPVVAAWVREEHPTAQRLIRHADRQYDVIFRLSYTIRPYAEALQHGAPITGSEGLLWKATFHLRGQEVRPSALWRESYLDRNARQLLVHMLLDHGTVAFTFPAVDDGNRVADAIGDAFDAVLLNVRPRRGSTERELSESPMRSIHLDPRIQKDSGWTTVDDSTVPISLFGA